jgi:serine/threonine protein kinase
MITGFVPFRGNNDYELHKNIISGNFQKIHFATFECNDLIQKLLNVNPNQRILLSDILKHNWFNEKINLFSVSLFTNAEKIIYYKMNINYTKGKIDDLTLGVFCPTDTRQSKYATEIHKKGKFFNSAGLVLIYINQQKSIIEDIKHCKKELQKV